MNKTSEKIKIQKIIDKDSRIKYSGRSFIIENEDGIGRHIKVTVDGKPVRYLRKIVLKAGMVGGITVEMEVLDV